MKKNKFLEQKVEDWRRVNLAIRRVVEIANPTEEDVAKAEGLVKEYEMKYSCPYTMNEPIE